jgi:hypothetical protein
MKNRSVLAAVAALALSVVAAPVSAAHADESSPCSVGQVDPGTISVDEWADLESTMLARDAFRVIGGRGVRVPSHTHSMFLRDFIACGDGDGSVHHRRLIFTHEYGYWQLAGIAGGD